MVKLWLQQGKVMGNNFTSHLVFENLGNGSTDIKMPFCIPSNKWQAVYNINSNNSALLKHIRLTCEEVLVYTSIIWARTSSIRSGISALVSPCVEIGGKQVTIIWPGIKTQTAVTKLYGRVDVFVYT